MKRHRNLKRWGLVLPCFALAMGWSATSEAAPPEDDDGGFSFEDDSEDAPEGDGDEFVMQPVDEEDAGDTGDEGDGDEFVMEPVDEADAPTGDGGDGSLSEDSGFTFEDISEDQEALDAELKTGEVQASGTVGTVSGKILNAKREPLAGVYVRAKDTKYVARTGVDGSYELRLPPGSYTLVVELDLYKSEELASVNVVAGEVASKDAELVPMAGVMETFEVSDDLNMEAEGALQEKRKQQTSVNDGIDATEISKSGGGKVSSVAVRIVGATVVDGRYLFVRGLGHRYGNTLLDGARVPSPEPELRTVPLDVFPSGALSAIDIQKSFTPDVPGDFAGGSTQFVTRDAPSEPSLTLGVAAGINTNTSFREGVTSPGYAGYDMLALGNIPRQLPSSFPKNGGVGRGVLGKNGQEVWSPEEIEAQGEALDTRTALSRMRMPANFNVKLSTGNSWSLNDNGGRFGVLFAGGYNNEHQTNREIVRLFGVSEGKPDLESARVDMQSFKTDYVVSYNGLLKLQYAANTNNRFALTGLYTREAHDETRDMYGTARSIAADDQFLNYTRQRYVMRSIAFTQLSGEHRLPKAGNMEIDYFGSFSQARRDDPALREMVFLYNEAGYYKVDNAAGPTGNQLFLDLVDNNENAALDIRFPFRQWKGLDAKVSVGAWVDAKQRGFTARRFEYLYIQEIDVPTGRDNPLNDSTIGDGTPAAAGGTEPFVLVDRLREQDNYNAWSRNVAGYVKLDLPFVRWFKISGGARIESNVISVTPYDLYNPDEVSDLGRSRLVDLDVLPAASLIFSPALPENSGEMNIRLGGTQTVARPEFRELAPFQFRDYVGGFSKQGFPDLQSTRIWNADLRLEWFPRPSEVVAISGFFKYFIDPIEEVVGASDNPSASWANAPSARNGGVELEFRKALDFLAPKHKGEARKVLRDFSVGANFAYIYSRVDLATPCHLPGQPNAQLPEAIPVENCRVAYQVSTSQSRPLQGQSPWIVNAYVDYDNDRTGTNLRLMYNAFGPYITQVQGFRLPDIYQEPMHMLDFNASQRLFAYKRNDWGDLRNELLLTFEVENMLNAVEQRNIGPVVYRTRDGVDVSLGLTWRY